MTAIESKSKDRRLGFIEILAMLGGLLGVVVAVQKFPSLQEEQAVGFFTVMLIVSSLFSYSFILYEEKAFCRSETCRPRLGISSPYLHG